MRPYLCVLIIALWLLYPVTLSAQTCVDPFAGIVSWWPLDHDAADIQNGNHGTLQNGALVGAPGKVQGALELDGQDDYVEISNASELNPASQITVACWYFAVSFEGNGNNSLVDKGYLSHTYPTYQYHLGVVGDLRPDTYVGCFAFSVSVDGISRQAASPNYSWSAGDWYHIAGTYDGSFVRLYVNGALADSITATGNMADYGKPVRIGAFSNLSGPGTCTPGLIDEVVIFDRALSSSEVSALYNADTAGMCRPSVEARSATWGRVRALYR